MKRFIEGEDRSQATLLPEHLDDYIGEDNPVRAVDAFVEELDLKALGFEGANPAVTGRPSYHPAVLLKLYIYGYLNRIASSRRLEREAQRNVELMWLTGRLAPDFKTIADFRRENGTGIRNVCRRFVELCWELRLFSQGTAPGTNLPAISGTTNYSEERCVPDNPNNAKMMACSFQNAGLRVFDIRDPSHAKEIAYWKPPAVRTEVRPSSGSWAPGVDRTVDKIAGWARWVVAGNGKGDDKAKRNDNGNGNSQGNNGNGQGNGNGNG